MAKTKVAVTRPCGGWTDSSGTPAIRTGAKPSRRRWRLNSSGSNIGVWPTSVPSSIRRPSGRWPRKASDSWGLTI